MNAVAALPADTRRPMVAAAVDRRGEELMARLTVGDCSAMGEVVEAYGPLLASITRSFRLAPSDADDVKQNTWLRLWEQLRVTQPRHLRGWLSAVIRTECIKLLQRQRREQAVGGLDNLLAMTQNVPELVTSADSVGADLEWAEAVDVLRAALRQLPNEKRRLITMLAEGAAPDYHEVSTALSIPIGSIGPTRGRVLRRLRGIISELGMESYPDVAA